MGRYLVTGAAGFIGSAVARHFVAQGHEVVTVDNLTTGNRENIPDGVSLIEGGCHEAHVVRELNGRQFDGILHIAGQSSGEVSFDDPIYDLQTNTQSTLLLLKYALEHDCAKFVFASTMSVYGEQPDAPVSEDAVCNPVSFYGVGKLASENYLRIYEGYGIQCTSLRLFNVYGPGQNMKNMRQGMVSIFVAQALKDHHIHVKGSLNRFRDFIYIDDVVKAFDKALARSNSSALVANIGTGRRTALGTLIDLIRQNEPGVVVSGAGRTPGDQYGIYADVQKAQKTLNFTAETALADGLRVMMEYYKGQRWL